MKTDEFGETPEIYDGQANALACLQSTLRSVEDK